MAMVQVSALGGMGGVGLGGVQGAAPGDLAGIFAALLGGEQAAGGDVTATLLQGMEGVTQVSDLGKNILELPGGAPVALQGEATAVAAFVQQIQVIYQQVVVEGGLSMDQLGERGELANALTKLGMDPEQAQMVAARIDTMLEILKQQQDIDNKGEGTLVAMLLAGMLQQQGGNHAALKVEVASVEVVTTSAVTVLKGFKGAADVVRDVVLGGGKTGGAEVADGTAEGLLKDAEGVAEGRQNGLQGQVKRELLVSVTPSEDGAKVEVVFPRKDKVGTDKLAMGDDVAADDDVLAADALMVPVVHVPVKPEALAQAPVEAGKLVEQASVQVGAALGAGVAQKVAAEKVLEKPEGETAYVWKADKNGHESLQAVKPVEAGVATTEQPAQHAGMLQGHGHAAGLVVGGAHSEMPFAERLEQARRVDVAQQVLVQVRPLLDQGGGTVRMMLNPAELGQVQVELKVVDGVVQGSISASQPAVLEQLARELHNFRHGLAEAGLKLGEQGINLMLNNNGNQQTGQNSGQGAGNGAGGSGSGLGLAGVDGLEDSVISAAEWIAPERVLDVKI